MLHSEFRHNYSIIGFIRNQVYEVVWQREGPINISRDVVHPDVEFVNKWNDGFYHSNQNRYSEALGDFREAQQRLGENFGMLSSLIGDSFLRMKIIDSALVYTQRALMIDTLCWEANINLFLIAGATGDTITAISQINYLKRLSPWVFEE
jgi:tetratricopeptide (TPR) repeat protein